MRVVVLHPRTKFEVRNLCRSENMARCVSALMGVVTLTFDLLTVKLLRESHQMWGTLVPNLGTLGVRVFQLFAMYATDGRTDRQNQRLLPPFLRAGHKNMLD